MSRYEITVECEQVVPTEELHHDDREDLPAGPDGKGSTKVYGPWVVEAASEEAAVYVALDRFHAEVPIANTEHFVTPPHTVKRLDPVERTVFDQNPDARSPWGRGAEVHEFESWDDYSANQSEVNHDAIPGFSWHDTWVTNPFLAENGAECDPMDRYGFKYRENAYLRGDIRSNAMIFPTRAYLYLADPDNPDTTHYLTDAFGAGLPSPRSWRLWSPNGASAIQTPQAYYVVVPTARYVTCECCGESRDPLTEYVTIYDDGVNVVHHVLCPDCDAAVGDDKEVLAHVPKAAFDIALDSVVFDCYNVHAGLAAIQAAVGQTDGGLAGVWWMDKEDGWADASPRDRMALLTEYAAYEGRGARDEAEEAAREAAEAAAEMSQGGPRAPEARAEARDGALLQRVMDTVWALSESGCRISDGMIYDAHGNEVEPVESAFSEVFAFLGESTADVEPHPGDLCHFPDCNAPMTGYHLMDESLPVCDAHGSTSQLLDALRNIVRAAR